MNASPNPSPLALERHFYHETDAAMDQVVKTLAALHEERSGFFDTLFRSSWREVNVLPIKNGYSVTLEKRRRNRSTTFTSARAEGSVRESADGRVIVDLLVSINAGHLYGSLALFVVIAGVMLATLGGSFGIFPLLLFGIVGMLVMYQSYADRNDLYHQLEMTAGSYPAANDRYAYKTKARPHEDLREISPPREAAPRKPSVWDEAISEYEDDRR